MNRQEAVLYKRPPPGSIRQSIDVSGNIVSANDCYAFGQTKSYTVVGSTVDKYKYTGKERYTETGLDYFGARYNDSKIGRWLSVDPLPDKYPGSSPYFTCSSNPINNVDSDGMEDEYFAKNNKDSKENSTKEDGKRNAVDKESAEQKHQEVITRGRRDKGHEKADVRRKRN